MAEEERLLAALYEKLNVIRQQNDVIVDDISESNDKSKTPRQNRILLVSRRLPFRLIREDSKIKAEFFENDWFDESMQHFAELHKNYPCIWLGTVAYDEMESIEQAALTLTLFQDHQYYPVFIPSKKKSLFYNGFCKKVLWPLFHSSPPTTEDQFESHEDDTVHERDIEKTWQAYVSVNQGFADAIQQIYQTGDIVWIQDYHFTLLPQMVRNLLPTAQLRIGYFLHIPFPSSELYRILTHREEILHGMLGSDLIGFQTYEYGRHFQSACVRILGLESTHKGIQIASHFSGITICPVGIHPKRFREIVPSDSVQDRIRQVENQFYGKKIVLGVNRLDPTSGLVHKFLAIEELLQSTPELAKELVFVDIILTNNSEDSMLDIEGMVSRINSQHQDIGGTVGPLHYLTREVSRDELLALLCTADVFITSHLRDGMNVIPFEYILCRDTHGMDATLILSEFAGSASSLGGAFRINPWNTEHFAEVILEALDQDEDERSQTHRHMCQYVNTFTSKQWADVFIEQLYEMEDSASPSTGRELTMRDLTLTYQDSKKRLLFFNYDGVFVSESSVLAKPSDMVLSYINTLTSDLNNTVVLVSARSKSMMEKWFHTTPNVILAAEYGVYIRWRASEEWKCSMPNLDMSWWEHVLPLLEYYTERTPGSTIERKESAVTWHFAGCDLDHGSWQATELQITLREVTRRMPIAVIPGNKTLEIRPRTINKAALFEMVWETLSADAIDFVLVVSPGNDRTDEDLFSMLIPPPIDLQAYCKQLEFEEEEEKNEEREMMLLKNPVDDPLANIILQSRPNQLLLLPPDRATTAMISADAVERFPSTLLNRPENIQDQKYIPRKDFPPSYALFKAMKRKYGGNYGMHTLPDTPAACWALVLPPDKLKDAQPSPAPVIQEPTPPMTATSRFPYNTFVCTIGNKLSQAPYYLKQPQDIYPILQDMARISGNA